MDVVYQAYIPCLPPGAICEIVHIYWRKKLEALQELGKVAIERGVNDWYKAQYAEQKIRFYQVFPGGARTDRYFAKLRVESEWSNEENESYTHLLGDYWGNNEDEYQKYLGVKNETIDLLDSLRSFAERNCKRLEIKKLVFLFIEEKIQIRIF